jgi:3-mercaptopyruvate sulfurtransferase SseA
MLDARTAQRKLALLGIHPKTPVVVIGYGHKGSGDEGRLAWALLYYGVNDVQTVSVDGLDVYFTHQETPARKNAEIWDTPVRENFVMDRADFIHMAMSPRKSNEHTTYIIDVRSKDEYFNRNEDYETPDLHALQIDWHEFYGGDGRPQKSIRSKLHGVDVKDEDMIVLISNNGVRSCAAAYALMALGFKHVRVFLGGWDALVKDKKK